MATTANHKAPIIQLGGAFTAEHPCCIANMMIARRRHSPPKRKRLRVATVCGNCFGGGSISSATLHTSASSEEFPTIRLYLSCPWSGKYIDTQIRVTIYL